MTRSCGDAVTVRRIFRVSVDGDALATLIVNRLRGAVPCAAVKAPGFGDRRKEMLQDIAILTGGQVVSEEVGAKLEHATPTQCGKAERVVISKDATTIVGGAGSKQRIQDRIGEGDERTGLRVLRRVDLLEAGIIDPTKVMRIARHRRSRAGAVTWHATCMISKERRQLCR